MALPLRVLINFYILNAVLQDHIHDLIPGAVGFIRELVQLFQNSFWNTDRDISITVITFSLNSYGLPLRKFQCHHLFQICNYNNLTDCVRIQL